MTTFVRAVRCANVRMNWMMYRMLSSDSQIPQWGSGAGHGGGSGGSVRESGGAFGVREAAMEDMYFRRVGAEQLEELHNHYIDEIHFVEKQLRELEETLSARKLKLKKLKEITHQDS